MTGKKPSTYPDQTRGCLHEVRPGEICGKKIINRVNALCSAHYRTWRRGIVKDMNKVAVPADLGVKVAQAKSQADWQAIAQEIAGPMQGILAGTVKASAAQVSLLKEILNRAYGRPVAAQEEKKQSTGIVILPTLDHGEKATVCPKCGYDVLKEADADMVRKLAVKALYNVAE